MSCGCASEFQRRRSIRLSGYDYRQAGAYFVTICTHEKALLLGEVVDGTVRLNESGHSVSACWSAIPEHFRNADVDAFVVMPNHLHGVVVIGNATGPAVVGAKHSQQYANASPLPPAGTQHGSLGAIVQNFKSVSTRKINRQRETPAAPVWQRNYYERVIRSERELNAIRQYIADNPLRWALDRENPDVRPLQ